jgi:hypothetical protein
MEMRDELLAAAALPPWKCFEDAKEKKILLLKEFGSNFISPNSVTYGCRSEILRGLFQETGSVLSF